MSKCDRRGCGAFPTHSITTDAPPVPKNETTTFDVCYYHARVAAEEFRATSNVLSARRVADDV